MFRKIIGLVVILSLVLCLPAIAADKSASKKSAGKTAEWDVSLSLIDAVSKAKDEISGQYANASAYSAVLKFSKSGKASYDIKFKISDTDDIKVSVSEDGVCKVAKKTTKVGKSAIKNKDNASATEKGGKASKSKKGKKAKSEEEEGGDEE